MTLTLNGQRSQGTSLETEDWYLCGSVSQGERIRETAISQQQFRAGRRSSCDLSLAWPTVSGVHAEFVVMRGALFLRDMGSTNGTFVNGRRIAADTPLDSGDVVHLGGVEFRVERRGENESGGTMAWNSGELTSRFIGFEGLVHGNELVPYFQPIVTLNDAAAVAFEVLARSSNPEFPSPFEMFETAEQLDREQELSEVCRRAGVRDGQQLPGNQRLYLNTQPIELKGTELIESLTLLRTQVPDQLLSLEIHEGAVTDLQSMTELRSRLNDLDIQLAYDDFGAGQARMLDLVEVPPDVLKFDISMIRDIHKASLKRRQMVGTLVSMVREFGIAPLAEGVESQDEADACLDLGFQYAQGFYFGRPAPAPLQRRMLEKLSAD